MKYYQIDITTSESGIEEITGFLFTMGIEETVVDNPGTAVELLDKKNSYEWDYVDEACLDMNREPKISFYLEESDENSKLIDDIREGIAGLENKNERLGSLELTVSEVDDEEWMNSYKDHFKTIDLTENIIVKPSWEEIPEGNTKKILELDPGMAFGTGDHATTSMCAVLMDEVGCSGKDVLDVGTGSGILAICADMLGAENVLGIDIDPIAVEVAVENAATNHCGTNVSFITGDLTKGTDFKADIVVANLMAEMVVMLAGAVKKHMKPGAVFISSGILVEKKDMVINEFGKLGLRVIKVMDKGEWSAILAEADE